MNDAGLAQLTEKEKEALRLVFSHPSFEAIARELNLTKGAIQSRFSSVYKRMGTLDRYEVARALARREGWAPYVDRIDTTDRVAGAPAVLPNHVTGSGSKPIHGLIELVDSLARLLGREGADNVLTGNERLVRTILVGLVIMIILSLLAASMGALGNFGSGLATQGIHQV